MEENLLITTGISFAVAGQAGRGGRVLTLPWGRFSSMELGRCWGSLKAQGRGKFI